MTKTGKGTRDWTEKELKQLRKNGKVKGYEGHHINSVGSHPDQAGNSNNIEFVKGRKGNLEKHGGNYQNQTSGDLIDRKQMLEDFERQNSPQ